MQISNLNAQVKSLQDLLHTQDIYALCNSNCYEDPVEGSIYYNYDTKDFYTYKNKEWSKEIYNTPTVSGTSILPTIPGNSILQVQSGGWSWSNINKDIPTNCINCGAPLHGHKCEYCDTEY